MTTQTKEHWGSLKVVSTNTDEAPLVTETSSEATNTANTEASTTQATENTTTQQNTEVNTSTETTNTTTENKEVVSETKGAFFEKALGKKTETTIPDDIPADIKDQLKELQELKQRKYITPELEKELSDYEALKNNESIKLLKGDKDIKDLDIKALIKKAAGADYSRFSNEDLLRGKLQSKYPNASKDDIEAILMDNVEKFSALSEAEQRAERSLMVDDLTKLQPASDIETVLKGLQEAQKASQNPEEFVRTQHEQAFNNLFKFFTDSSPELEGQTYKGYTVTKEDALAIPQKFESDVKAFDQEQKKFDYFKIVTYDKAVEAAEKRGYEKGLKDRANPTHNNTSDQVLMNTNTTGDEKKDANYFKNMKTVTN